MITEKRHFVKALLKWDVEINNRPMPWKGEKDPYKIWLSEIILQQTRVEQGWDYYNRFVAAFPDVKKLAKAPEQKIFKLWEGLGYYTRCKNLIATAKFIATECKGKFPSTYEAILNLKGIGPYTAAAIGSFAFDLPHAVVDGNVFRVLSRYFGIATPIDSTEGKKIFTRLANELLEVKQPGKYNQALMDFGAVVCKPKLPLCRTCPLKKKCVAYINNRVDVLPAKEKSITKKNRWLYYFIVEQQGKTWVRKRSTKDIWENLYEFILIETAAALPMEKIKTLPEIKKQFGNNKFTVTAMSKWYRQQLSHQTIQGQFIKLQVEKTAAFKGYELVSNKQLAKLPFPKFITAYLKDKNVSLNLF